MALLSIWDTMIASPQASAWSSCEQLILKPHFSCYEMSLGKWHELRVSDASLKQTIFKILGRIVTDKVTSVFGTQSS